jgi:DNA processing protein
VLSETDARLVLFSTIEPADNFWSLEISNSNALNVIERILSGKYYLRQKNILNLQHAVVKADLSDLKNELNDSGAIFITPIDTDWPMVLNDLHCPPIGLVIKGKRNVLNDLDKSISIVGSRKPTSYGHQIAKTLAMQAARRDLVVVSGGAYGIDTAAHIGALAAGGKTICVLAGGVNRLYPNDNKKLFDHISTSGLLISEVMPNVASKPYRFLIRNRLIAALSKATVVVEAEFVSGSIRTARDAAEIFRPVFAIPGEVTSALSEGCHRLIAERIADIATNLDEILEIITPLQLR